MLNLRNQKFRRTIILVVVILLVIGMVVPTILTGIL